MKLVSIIVPTYNRATLILETLESIRKQTYPSVEIVVVDDGSTDGTSSVVRNWFEQYNVRNCIYCAMEQNAGKSAAVNYAFEIIHGDYVMILDSDDVLLENGIELEVRFLESNPNVGMVSANAWVIDGQDKKRILLSVLSGEGDIPDLQARFGDLLLNANMLISSTVLLRHKVIHRIGGLNWRLRYIHDWEYWIRVSRMYKISYLNQPVLYYRRDSVGASSAKRFRTYREICLLILEARHLYRRSDVLKSMITQMRNNTSLAFYDHNTIDLVRIPLYGVYAYLKCLVG
jgi:glycosyltransferase involved in cell wall biosynthesis